MADERKPEQQERGAAGLGDVVLAGEEEDVLFKTQMAIANFFLGYWKQGLGVLGVILALVFAYGQWQTYQRDVQREMHAQISKISKAMPEPDPMSLYGLGPKDDPNDADRMAKLAASAQALESVAKQGDGAAAIYAWLQAADAWTRAGKSAESGAAYAAAHALGAEGVLGWNAASGLAASRADAGDVDGAAQVLQAWADANEDVTAQQATLQLGLLYEHAGRTEDARKVFQQFGERFSDSPLATQVTLALGRLGSTG